MVSYNYGTRLRQYRKKIWADHALDLSRFVLDTDDNAMRAALVDQQTQADLLYGLSLFGSIGHDPQVFKQRIPEELMQESKFYQLECERITRETTVRHILTLLKRQFRTETVNALTPAIQNINDLQRLEQLLVAASETQNIETFAQMLHE